MPTYKFKNKQTGKQWTELMSISEMEKLLASDNNLELMVHGAPMIGHRTLTKKPDSGFRDVLKTIKKKHRGSKINTW